MKDYGLNEIPEEVFKLQNLKILILSGNPLEKIPKEIGLLTQLQVLQLADCGLFDDSLPEDIATLQLEELTLSNNGLTGFDLLTKIATLKRLNISGNDIMTLPQEVSQG